MAIATVQDGFFILKYNADIVCAYIEQGIEVPADGISDAFEVSFECVEQFASIYLSTIGYLPDYGLGLHLFL